MQNFMIFTYSDDFIKIMERAKIGFLNNKILTKMEKHAITCIHI